MNSKEECIHCGSSKIVATDSTYSNTGENAGHLTGIIFTCQNCDGLQIDNYISGKTEPFNY